MNNQFNLQFSFSPEELGNASVKMLLKDFIFDTYAEIRNAFTDAKINEKLNFYKSIIPYVCAKQQDNDRQGEWAPDDSMDSSWLVDAQKNRSHEQQRDFAENERDKCIMAFRQLVRAEEVNYQSEFERIACELYKRILDDEFFNNIKNRLEDEEEYVNNFTDALFNVIIYELRRVGFEPPCPMHMFSTNVYPTFYLSEEEVQKIKQLSEKSEQPTTTTDSLNPSTLELPSSTTDDTHLNPSIIEPTPSTTG